MALISWAHEWSKHWEGSNTLYLIVSSIGCDFTFLQAMSDSSFEGPSIKGHSDPRQLQNDGQAGEIQCSRNVSTYNISTIYLSGTDLHEAAECPRPSLNWEHISAQRRRVNLVCVQYVDGLLDFSERTCSKGHLGTGA